MLRKLFISSLIALMPIQSWAVLDMGLQHQLGKNEVVHASEEAKSSVHPCHQQAWPRVPRRTPDSEAADMQQPHKGSLQGAEASHPFLH